MPRATPLPADERRAAIMAATEPLLEVHGRDVSTRQIAEAAGVAEGTIFRVFPTKEALIDAVVEDVFDHQITCAELSKVDHSLALEQRLEAAVDILQTRLRRVFALFHSLKLPSPDDRSHESFRDKHHADNLVLNAALAEILEPDRSRLAFTPVEAAGVLRTFTFCLTHPFLSDGRFADPSQIVQLLLHGVLTHPRPRSLPSEEGPAC
jgi:AcrR family transcriptional regulator